MHSMQVWKCEIYVNCLWPNIEQKFACMIEKNKHLLKMSPYQFFFSQTNGSRHGYGYGYGNTIFIPVVIYPWSAQLFILHTLTIEHTVGGCIETFPMDF